MTVDADTAKYHIQLAVFLNDLHNSALVAGLGEDAVLGQHIQLLVNLGIKGAIHTATEGKRMIIIDIGAILIEVLVHVHKHAILEGNAVSVDKLGKTCVRTDGTVGHHHDGGLTLFVVLGNHLKHLNGDLPIHVDLMLANVQLNVAALTQLLGRDQIDILFHCSAPP